MKKLLSPIRLAVFDVDGVLTDGRVGLDGSGEVKAFHVQDGAGLKALIRAGIQVAFLTARRSTALEARARELGVTLLHQGASPKLPVLQAMAAELGVAAREVFYMGDDLPDIECLRWSGVPCAPANARPEVKSQALVLLGRAGGDGAAREAAELLLAARAG